MTENRDVQNSENEGSLLAEGQGKAANGIGEIASIRYLTPDMAFFAKTEGGFLSLSIKEDKDSLKEDEDSVKDKEGASGDLQAAVAEGGAGESTVEGSGESKEEKNEEKPEEKNEFARVSLHRAFPFKSVNEYISVRTTEGKEIGIIKNVMEFPEETVDLFRYELDRRYFTPRIEKINNIKEEFGYAYWDVITDSGPKRFTVQNVHNNLLQISDTRIMAVDVDGNRFEIPDMWKLDQKSLKMVERLL